MFIRRRHFLTGYGLSRIRLIFLRRILLSDCFKLPDLFSAQFLHSSREPHIERFFIKPASGKIPGDIRNDDIQKLRRDIKTEGITAFRIFLTLNKRFLCLVGCQSKIECIIFGGCRHKDHPDLTVFQDSFLPDHLQEILLCSHGKGILHRGSLPCSFGGFPVVLFMTVIPAAVGSPVIRGNTGRFLGCAFRRLNLISLALPFRLCRLFRLNRLGRRALNRCSGRRLFLRSGHIFRRRSCFRCLFRFGSGLLRLFFRGRFLCLCGFTSLFCLLRCDFSRHFGGCLLRKGSGRDGCQSQYKTHPYCCPFSVLHHPCLLLLLQYLNFGPLSDDPLKCAVPGSWRTSPGSVSHCMIFLQIQHFL